MAVDLGQPVRTECAGTLARVVVASSASSYAEDLAAASLLLLAGGSICCFESLGGVHKVER